MTEAAFLATWITLEILASGGLVNETSWRLGDLEEAIAAPVLESVWSRRGPGPLRIRLVELEQDNLREHHLRQRTVPLHRSPWMFGLDRAVIRVALLVEVLEPLTGRVLATERYRGRTAWEPDLDRELAFRGEHRPYAGYLVADATERPRAGALSGPPRGGRGDTAWLALREAVQNAVQHGPSGGR